MGKPAQANLGPLLPEFIGEKKRTEGTETSHVPPGKEIDRDSLSSGERKGNSLNRRTCPSGLQDLDVGEERLAEAVWKNPP